MRLEESWGLLDMKSNWEILTLENVCSRIYSGGTPSTKHPEYWNGNIKWLSSGETSQRFIYDTDRKITQLGVDNSSTKLAKAGSTVIATAGQGLTRGQASFLMTDTYMNQSVIACEPNQEYVLPLFLYYNLDNRYEEFRLLSDGTSTRGGLSGWIVKRMEIVLPPMEEQKKIISILEIIDKKIELNKKINDNLSQQIQLIYDNLADGLTGDPVNLSSIIDVRDGTHDSPKAVDEGFPLVTSKHLLPYGVDLSTANLISKEDFDKTNERSIVETHDILISMIGTVGLISLVIDNPVPFAIKNVGLFKTSKFPELYAYILTYLRSTKTTQHIEKTLVGSTQKYISLGELRKMPIILPDENQLNDFNSIVVPLIMQITNLTEENKRLAELRDMLLPKLMSGEFDISDIEI